MNNAIFVKEANDFRVVGFRDSEQNYLAECSCGHSLFGFQDRGSMQDWVRSHAARHLLKAVAK